MICKLLRRWKYRKEWPGKCSQHGFECPCSFHAHNPIGIEIAYWIPYYPGGK